MQGIRARQNKGNLCLFSRERHQGSLWGVDEISESNGARMQTLMLACALAIMALGVAVAVFAVIALLE
jgi:hypothetical protein